MKAESREELFKDTPSDNAKRWQMELQAAKEKLADWHKEAAEADDALLMKKSSLEGESHRRLAFFTANVAMQRATMYGRAPQVTCSRRFADANDDVARVASEIQERLLNTDIERDSDTSTEAFGNALLDSLETDFACVRARYVAEFEDIPETPAILDEATGRQLAPTVPATRKKTREDVEIDYLHWRDVLWGPSRVWSEVPWVGFLALMSRKELAKKFGEEVAAKVPLNAQKKSDDGDAKKAHPWARAEVWEIWEKKGKRVFWVVEGYDSVLIPVGIEVDEGGAQPDPLELEGFWPCPKPVVLNATTSAFVPKPDYALTREVYKALDVLESRCGLLVDALKVAGVYDKTMGADIGRILERGENQLIPADNWAMFAEKGGVRGAIDWFPMEQVANTLNALRDVMREKQDLLYQLTGRSDLERGQATQAGATATEQRAKVKYGSVRMQRRQDEFARLVSDVMRIKAQIISKWFDPQTILQRCNCEFTADAQVAPQAVELLKSRGWQFRIEVKPEALALQDFAALKEERTEVIAAIAQYMSAIMPMAGAMPGAMPLFLKILQWLVAGLRGAKQIEGVLDQAIQMAEQAAARPPQQQPDPKLLAQQMKGQQELAKVEAETKARLMEIAAETQAHAIQEQNQRLQNVQEHAQKQAISNSMRPPLPPNGRGGLP